MSDFQMYAVIFMVGFVFGVFFALTMGWIEGGDDRGDR
jgi:hypothetical protein